MIYSSSCKTGEGPAGYQREKDEVDGGGGGEAVEMIKGGDIVMIAVRSGAPRT